MLVEQMVIQEDHISRRMAVLYILLGVAGGREMEIMGIHLWQQKLER